MPLIHPVPGHWLEGGRSDGIDMLLTNERMRKKLEFSRPEGRTYPG